VSCATRTVDWVTGEHEPSAFHLDEEIMNKKSIAKGAVFCSTLFWSGALGWALTDSLLMGIALVLIFQDAFNAQRSGDRGGDV
jgi:hypothetical protein